MTSLFVSALNGYSSSCSCLISISHANGKEKFQTDADFLKPSKTQQPTKRRTYISNL